MGRKITEHDPTDETIDFVFHEYLFSFSIIHLIVAFDTNVDERLFSVQREMSIEYIIWISNSVSKDNHSFRSDHDRSMNKE